MVQSAAAVASRRVGFNGLLLECDLLEDRNQHRNTRPLNSRPAIKPAETG